MPYTTLVSGTVITASWANASVRDQGVTPFATAAARTSAVTSPVEGMLSYQTDAKIFKAYDGVNWREMPMQVIARKTADETVNNSAAIQTDDALIWRVEANGIYALDVWLLYSSGTTPDIKFGYTYPGGLTMLWNALCVDTSLATTLGSGYSGGSVVSMGGSGGDASARIWGIVTNGANAGNLAQQWAQNTANASDTTVKAGTFGILTRMA